jgi:hypothetical protein
MCAEQRAGGGAGPAAGKGARTGVARDAQSTQSPRAAGWSAPGSHWAGTGSKRMVPTSILSCKRILRLDPLLQEDLAPRSSLARGSCASILSCKRILRLQRKRTQEVLAESPRRRAGAGWIRAAAFQQRSSRSTTTAPATQTARGTRRRRAAPRAPRAAAWRPVMHRRGVPGAMLTRARRTRRVRLVRGEGRGVST